MTTEEKVQAYSEAIERLRKLLKNMEKEKALIEMLSSIGKKDWKDIPTEKMIAWLEKQDKHLENQAHDNIENGIRRRNTIQVLEYARSLDTYNQFGKADIDKDIAWLEKQGDKPQGKTALEAWKDMRLEVYQQASGNRHEPNYSDDTTKLFSLNDIDEIIEKMSEQKPADNIGTKFKAGDWIIVNDIDYPNPMQIDGMYKKNGGYYAILSYDLSADVDMIKPIPLTKEILEKNTKVEPIESSPVDYTDYVFDEDTSVVYEKGEPFMFYHESSKRDHIYKKVEYVHELQHLLRLVGYEKEIKL